MSPCRLFSLGGVPEDEADDIRELLGRNSIDYYEVPGSFLGVSPPSIWLHDQADSGKAKALIGAYQIERANRARDEYEKRSKEGQNKTAFDSMKEHPFRFFVYLAIIAGVLYLSLVPFLNFGK